MDPDSADFLTAADSSGAVVLVAARTDVGSVWLCRVGDALAPATAAAAVDAVADVLADRPVKSVAGPLLLVTPMLAALATRNAALPPLARIMKMYLYTFDADCLPAAEAVAARIPDASLDRVAADRLHDLVPFLQGFNEAVFGQATTPTDACMERLSFLHRLGGLRVLNHGGVARCSVAVTGKVPSGVRRVGFVFTSKEHRGCVVSDGFCVAVGWSCTVSVAVCNCLFVCLFVCLSLCLSVSLSLCLSVSLSLCLCPSLCLSVSLSLCLSVSPSLRLSVSVSVSVSVSLCLCLSVSLSLSLCVCVSLCLAVCVSVCVCLCLCLSVSVILPLFTRFVHCSHGYATVASSRLGLELLRDGAPSVCLFADIDNAVSNATYARAGWKKQDVVMGLAILKTSPLDKTSE